MDSRGGQHRFHIVIYSVQKKKVALSEGGSLSGGGLMGDYCIFSTLYLLYTIILLSLSLVKTCACEVDINLNGVGSLP